MTTRTAIHGLVLALASLFGYRFGIAWGTYSSARIPSAMPIPVTAIVTVFTFTFWYHIVNAVDQRKWQAIGYRSWRAITLIALVALTCITIQSPRMVFGLPLSVGRAVSLIFTSAACIVLTIAVVSGQSSWHSDTFLRTLLKIRLVRIALGAAAIATATTVTFLVIDGVFYFVNLLRPEGPAKVYEGNYIGAGNFFDSDANLGTRLLPEKNVACRLKIGDQMIWDVNYGTDSFGRRRTVTNDGASQYAIFFGCSYLFGEGALDRETIPSRFSERARDFQCYNYGVPGFGTQQMLAKLEQGGLSDEISQTSGVVFYLYLPETHESRVIGEFQVFNTFASRFPFYSLDSEGRLVRTGSFESGRPVTSTFYSLMGMSHTVKYLGLNFPRRRESHYQLTAKIIERSRNLCRQQLKCDQFYVVVYPRPIDVRILPYLDDLGIAYLDYSRLFDPLADGMSHPIDGHPTPKANERLAKELVEDTLEASVR